MPDTKLADLTALTTTSDDDILYVVDDPAGTPADRKLALSDVFKRGTVTTSSPVIDASQTWNDGAVTFTGLRFNAATGSSAGSAAASLLMDLQLEGVLQFGIQKNGVMRFPGNLEIRASASTVDFFSSSQVRMRYSSGTLSISDNLGFGTLGTNPDLFLARRGAANLRLGAADTSASATITVTIAAPGVVTWSSNHSLSTGSPVIFTTTGALPTGITSDTTYYAIVVSSNTFQLASSFANALAGTAITTSGSQSGTHTGRRGAIAQQFGPQDTLSTGSLENIDGADFVIRGSRSIGNKPGGSIIFQVAPAGSSGTAQNALATAWTVDSASRLIGSSGGTAAAPAVSLPNNVGLFAPATNTLAFSLEGTERGRFEGALGFGLARDSLLWWSNNTINAFYSNRDTILARDAANTLALRNGANAQTFRVYNTYTSATDFERGNIFWDSNVLKIGTEKGSAGGTARALEFQTDGTTRLTIAATTGNVTTTGSVTTEAPTGGTAAAWRLGTVASVSPTSPNRTIEVDIGGTIYYLHAKTTND